MLQNGLGEVLEREMEGAGRFVDLFTGSAYVAGYVAKNFDIPVLASDLQGYSVTLANAVICRREPLESDKIWTAWIGRAEKWVERFTEVPHSKIKLSIQDDGKGFDVIRKSEGNGLNNMKKRAADLKGKFEIHSSADKGTTVHLVFAYS